MDGGAASAAPAGPRPGRHRAPGSVRRVHSERVAAAEAFALLVGTVPENLARSLDTSADRELYGGQRWLQEHVWPIPGPDGARWLRILARPTTPTPPSCTRTYGPVPGRVGGHRADVGRRGLARPARRTRPAAPGSPPRRRQGAADDRPAPSGRPRATRRRPVVDRRGGGLPWIITVSPGRYRVRVVTATHPLAGRECAALHLVLDPAGSSERWALVADGRGGRQPGYHVEVGVAALERSASTRLA